MTKAVGHTAAAFVIFADFPIWAATTYVQSHWHFQLPCATNSMPNHAKRVRKEASWKVVGNVLHQYWSHSGFFSWEDFFFRLSRVVSYRYNDDLGILVWALPSWDAWGHVKLHGFEWHVKPPTEVHEPNGVARDDIYIFDKGAMFLFDKLTRVRTCWRATLQICVWIQSKCLYINLVILIQLLWCIFLLLAFVHLWPIWPDLDLDLCAYVLTSCLHTHIPLPPGMVFIRFSLFYGQECSAILTVWNCETYHVFVSLLLNTYDVSTVIVTFRENLSCHHQSCLN